VKPFLVLVVIDSVDISLIRVIISTMLVLYKCCWLYL